MCTMPYQPGLIVGKLVAIDDTNFTILNDEVKEGFRSCMVPHKATWFFVQNKGKTICGEECLKCKKITWTLDKPEQPTNICITCLRQAV